MTLCTGHSNNPAVNDSGFGVKRKEWKSLGEWQGLAMLYSPRGKCVCFSNRAIKKNSGLA